jgi:hypothetical protein
LGQEYRSLSSSLCNFIHSPLNVMPNMYKKYTELTFAIFTLNTFEQHSIQKFIDNIFFVRQ